MIPAPPAQQLHGRIGPDQATTTAIKALPVDHESRVDGCITLCTADGSLWFFDDDSTATAQDGVLVPDSGSGRWFLCGGSGGSASDYKGSVVAATTGALAAYTRTANVILADANGAIGAIDGVTLAVGDRLLLKDGAAGADNGIYRVDVVGDGSNAYQLTRATDFDTSAKVTAGALVYVSEGTVNGDEFFFLSTNDDITLNTTSLTFTKLPNQADLASTASGLGASLIGIQDAGAIITATTVEGALAENRTAIDAAEAAIDAVEATLGTITVLQLAGGTFANGTATINAGITVTADTDAFVLLSTVVSGSANVGTVAHLKASNVVGGPGVGAVTLNILGADGAVDGDAAGDFRVLLVN